MIEGIRRKIIRSISPAWRKELESACPDIELLAAYLENNLSKKARKLVEAHLLECRLCRRVVAQAIKSKSVVPDPLLPRKTSCS